MNQDIPQQGIKLIELKKEFVRKSLHVLIAFLPFFVLDAPWVAISLLGAGSLIYGISEFIRLSHLYDSKRLARLFKPIMIITEYVARGNEKNSFVKSPVTMAAGAILAILFYPFGAMKMGILALAFGDTAAALLGRSYPIRQLPFVKNKSLGGVIGCFSATFITAYIIFGDLGKALLIASVTTFIEALPFSDYDNLMIPIIVGYTASLLL